MDVPEVGEDLELTVKRSIVALLATSAMAFGVAAGLLVAGSQAQAHASLVSASPAANATVVAPRLIALHFSEKLAPKFSGASLMSTKGKNVAVRSSIPTNDAKSVNLAVMSKLAPGSYMVMWHAVAADDGHRSKGSVSFRVR